MAIVTDKELSDRRDRQIKQGKRALGIGGLMVMSAQECQERSPFRMLGNQLNPCLLLGQAACWRDESATSVAPKTAPSIFPRSANRDGRFEGAHCRLP